MAPVPKYRQPANKEAHPPAVLNFPPPTPVLPSEAQVQANKLASAISASHQKQESAKSMAEEAAEKANEKASAARKSRIEELRAKVKSTKVKSTKVEVSGHAAKEGAEAAPSTTAAETDPLAKDLSKLSISPQAVQSPGGGGLQSPSSGAWKETGGTLEDSLRTTIQSPTSSSWKPPAETSLAQDTFAGAKVQSISAEEAKKIESQEMIKEEFEPASADSEKQKSVVKEEQKAEA